MAELGTKPSDPPVKRRRGAPQGRANGNYRHGKLTKRTQARLDAEWDRQQAAAAAWAASRPRIDYQRICAELDALRRQAEQDGD